MNGARILHVITTVNRGGAENHLFDLVQHQRAAGMEVMVAFLRGETRELHVPVHDLALRFYGDPGPLFRLRDLIALGDFDLVHAHMPPAELYARLSLLGLDRPDLPLLITKHNEERFCNAPGQCLLGRWVARRAERVIAISHAVKRYMASDALGIEAQRIEVIHYGIDAEPFAVPQAWEAAEIRRGWGIREDELAIGFVGRLVPQKDLRTLLHGFAEFASEFPRTKLVIVGAGELDAELRRGAEELGVADRVVWAGFRDDIAGVMRAFDIFALTSIYEGLGLVLLEAMAAQRPVVATRVGAIPEVVADGKTGLLVAPRQPAELAAAFQQLTDATLRHKFGSAGRERVMQKFTLEKMGAETDALYARCLRAARNTRKEAIACAASTAS